MITHNGNSGKNWKFNIKVGFIQLSTVILCVLIIRLFNINNSWIILLISIIGAILYINYRRFLLSDKTGRYDKKHWNDPF